MINLPGSKSISQRALIAKWLTGSKTKIDNLNEGYDVKLLAKALKGGKNLGNNATGYTLLKAAFEAKGIKTDFKISKRLEQRLKNRVTSQNESAEIIRAFIKKTSYKKKVVGYPALTKKVLSDFKKRPKTYKIENDFSAAAPFFLWSFLNGKVLKMDLPKKSLQPDSKISKYFNSKWSSIDVKKFPDGVLSLMIASPFFGRKVTFKNAEVLNKKESERTKEIAKFLRRLGAKVKEGKDLTVYPVENFKPLKFKVNPKNDHRLAMNFTMIPGIEVTNKNCVKKSFPGFWEEFKKLKA